MSHILFQTEMVTANKQISPKTFCKTARFAVAAGHGEWSKTEFRYILFFPSHPSFMKNSRMNFQIHFLRPLPFYRCSDFSGSDLSAPDFSGSKSDFSGPKSDFSGHNSDFSGHNSDFSGPFF
jgi:hypothetical protein